MEKFYVLAHASHRLRDDFFPCGTHVKKPPCSACGGNVNELVAPLLYFWDFEFGDPQASINAGHNCLWGQFQLMVDEFGRSVVESLGLAFSFHRTERAEGPDVVGLADSRYWATPSTTAEADPIASKIPTCEHCGEFTERRRAVTRLRVPRSNVPEGGVFVVTQNGAWGPTFVTEDSRTALIESKLVGVGFYPAGRIV